MPPYAALLRGISPTNPNMHNEKLRAVFEGLGYRKVQTVISSGNVLFESPSKNTKSLEAAIEKALFEKLGIRSTTIIRSKEELQKLADKDPFGKLEHSKTVYLTVTFLKTPTKAKLPPPQLSYRVLEMYDREVCTSTDLASTRGPELMLWLEKQFGKQITTRTYKTVNRILEKMGQFNLQNKPSGEP